MTDMNQEPRYHVNLHKVVEQTEFLAVTRLLAISIMKNPYMRVCDFVKSLSNDDLQILMDVYEEGLSAEIDEDIDNRLEEFILIAEMLALAEGLDGPTADDTMKRTNQLSVFLTLESLKRKDLIKLHYENMSFGEDFDNKIIAEKR